MALPDRKLGLVISYTLAEQHKIIEAKLDEAFAAKARGDFAPLEPLHVFLRGARERLAAKR